MGGRSCIEVLCLGNHGGAVEASGGCVGVKRKATPHFSTFAPFARLRSVRQFPCYLLIQSKFSQGCLSCETQIRPIAIFKFLPISSQRECQHPVA